MTVRNVLKLHINTKQALKNWYKILLCEPFVVKWLVIHWCMFALLCFAA